MEEEEIEDEEALLRQAMQLSMGGEIGPAEGEGAVRSGMEKEDLGDLGKVMDNEFVGELLKDIGLDIAPEEMQDYIEASDKKKEEKKEDKKEEDKK